MAVRLFSRVGDRQIMIVPPLLHDMQGFNEVVFL